MNHYAVRQTSGKRFLAGFLDFIMTAFLAVLLYVPVLAITNYAGWGEVAVELYYHGLYSGLYDANEVQGLNEINDPERLPEALYNFYVDDRTINGERFRGYAPILVAGKDFNDAEDYYVVILKKDSPDSLFDFSAPLEKPYKIPAKAGQEDAVKAFYVEEIADAHQLFNELPVIENLYIRHYRFLFITVFSAYTLAALSLNVFLPLVLKKKVTLGKIFTKTIVLNQLGYDAKKSQLFMRNLAVFLFSYVFFFMPFHIISFGLGLMSKDHRSLYDRLALTMVADQDKTLTFASVYDEEKYRKELAGQLLAIKRQKEAGVVVDNPNS